MPIFYLRHCQIEYFPFSRYISFTVIKLNWYVRVSGCVNHGRASLVGGVSVGVPAVVTRDRGGRVLRGCSAPGTGVAIDAPVLAVFAGDELVLEGDGLVTERARSYVICRGHHSTIDLSSAGTVNISLLLAAQRTHQQAYSCAQATGKPARDCPRRAIGKYSASTNHYEHSPTRRTRPYRHTGSATIPDTRWEYEVSS